MYRSGRRYAALSLSERIERNEGIEFADKIASGIGRYPLANVAGCGLAHFAEAMPILPRSVHCFVEQFDRGSFGYETVDAITDQLPVSANVGCDAWPAAEHRFDHRKRHAFVIR